MQNVKKPKQMEQNEKLDKLINEKLDKLINVQFELITQQKIRIDLQLELIKEQRIFIERLKCDLKK